MTREERKIALHCLKASSDYHSEVCEECVNYPNCDHTMQDDVTESIIKELEQEPMQVELEGDGYADGFLVYDYGKCPKCGWQYEEGDKDWKEPFCCHCGQKLKWFNNESEASN